MFKKKRYVFDKNIYICIYILSNKKNGKRGGGGGGGGKRKDKQLFTITLFDWRGETSEVFVVRTAINLLAILLLAANLLANIC